MELWWYGPFGIGGFCELAKLIYLLDRRPMRLVNRTVSTPSAAPLELCINPTADN